MVNKDDEDVIFPDSEQAETRKERRSCASIAFEFGDTEAVFPVSKDVSLAFQCLDLEGRPLEDQPRAD